MSDASVPPTPPSREAEIAARLRESYELLAGIEKVSEDDAVALDHAQAVILEAGVELASLLAQLQQARQERDERHYVCEAHVPLGDSAFDTECPCCSAVAADDARKTADAALQQARQEIAQLTGAAADFHMDYRMRCDMESKAALIRAEQAEAALRQAREALREFGQHHKQCTHTFGMQDVPCTCGLDAALKAVR